MTGDNKPSLRNLMERYCRLRQDQAALAKDLRELFGEAKVAGFDTCALRVAAKAVYKRRQAEAQGRLPFLDEQASLVTRYINDFYRGA